MSSSVPELVAISAECGLRTVSLGTDHARHVTAAPCCVGWCGPLRNSAVPAAAPAATLPFDGQQWCADDGTAVTADRRAVGRARYAAGRARRAGGRVGCAGLQSAVPTSRPGAATAAAAGDTRPSSGERAQVAAVDVGILKCSFNFGNCYGKPRLTY